MEKLSITPITKLYIKVFLLTGIPYGTLMFIFDWFDGQSFNPVKWFFMSVFFGMTMSVTLVSSHRYKLKMSGILDLTDKNLNTFQSKNITSEFPPEVVLQKLKTTPFTAKMQISEMTNGIMLTSGFSWKSWGEVIQIIPISQKDSGFAYQITSRPKVKATLVDYGKNLENIQLMEKIIS